MHQIKDIISYLESLAPPAYQESYDNATLLTGQPSTPVTGVMVCLDCTEAVVQEAVQKGCNLIVAHHPIIFKGLKSLTGRNYVERTIIKAIENKVAIYAIHTNLDNVHTGVNHKIAQIIGLRNTQILAPKSNTLSKLVCFVPQANTQQVLAAMHQAGAGHIGQYSHCSFKVTGTGAFKPSQQANPTIGQAGGPLEQVQEDRIEVLLPTHLSGRIINAMQQAHPYEEVAHYLTPLANTNQQVGSGMVGTLPEPMPATQALAHIKKAMNLPLIRHTPLVHQQVHTVALCGGAGGFLLPKAIKAGAQLFITADIKYHEFFDANDQIILADIGHYESEQYTMDHIYALLNSIFTNIALHLTKVVTNPINYF